MLVYVSLTQIDDNPFQRRQEYGDIAELAADILRHSTTRPETLGLQQVPAARLVGDDGELVPTAGFDSEDWLTDKNQLRPGWRVQLEFGHRRKRAFAYLVQNGAYEYGRMPLNILDLSDDDLLNGVWSENRARRDLSAVEEAELLKTKLERMGENGSHKALGDEWGLSRPVISNRLRLLELPDAVQQANRDGRLSERQALALKPIIEIDQLVNGRVEWGENFNQMWGMPAGADKVVEMVLAEPEKFTSDDLRSHARKMAENAGKMLPDCVARHDYGALPGIEQPQCKGCRFRIDQRCLDTACWAHKVEVWPDIAVEKFSQETGLPMSDREEDFSAGNYAIHDHVLKLYEAGITDGMVCGWLVGCAAARPLVGGNWESDGMRENGRAGIVLGWRGKLPPLPKETVEDDGEPRYDVPTPDRIEAWKNQASGIQKAAEGALLDAVTDALSYQVAEFDVLQALIFHRDNDWIDEQSKLVKKITEFLVDKGRGVVWAGTTYEAVQLLQSTAQRAGLGINLLGDEEDVVANKTAVLILARWYSIHETYYWEEYARQIMEWIAAFRQLPRAGFSHFVDDIERAWRHIEQKLTLEGSSEVDTYNGDWTWWTDRESERWTCPNCGEEAVSWQGNQGSCGECGNEMVMDEGELYAKMVADEETAVSQEEPNG